MRHFDSLAETTLRELISNIVLALHRLSCAEKLWNQIGGVTRVESFSDFLIGIPDAPSRDHYLVDPRVSEYDMVMRLGNPYQNLEHLLSRKGGGKPYWVKPLEAEASNDNEGKEGEIADIVAYGCIAFQRGTLSHPITGEAGVKVLSNDLRNKGTLVMYLDRTASQTNKAPKFGSDWHIFDLGSDLEHIGHYLRVI